MPIELNVDYADIQPRLLSEPFELTALKLEKSSHDNFDRVSRHFGDGTWGIQIYSVEKQKANNRR